MLPDPREVERKLDKVRLETRRILALSDGEMPAAARRDRVMQLTGQAEELEAKARELREHDDEQAAAALAGAKPLAGADHSAGHRGSRDPRRAANTEAWAQVRSILAGEFRGSITTSTGVGGGGYLIPNPLVEEYMDIARKADPILADSSFHDLSGGNNYMELPIKQTHGSVAWAGESEARGETTEPEFGDVTLACFDVYGYYWGTRLWFDTVPDSKRIIMDELQDSVWEDAGVRFAVGDGSSKPQGLFTNTGEGGYLEQLSSTSNALDAQQFLNAVMKLKPRYLANAAWYMNGTTLAGLLALAMPNMTNTPLVTWQGSTAYILGHPVKIADSAPDVGDGAYPVALGDLSRAYAIGSHVPNVMWLQVDTFTSPQLVKWYGLARLGGTPYLSEACVLLKSDAT